MPFEPRQIRLFAILFVVLVAALTALWFFVLRTEYIPAYQNIREADASQIVAELDNQGISYRLENNGHDILVPKSQAADARVAVAGANIAMGGTTGFELFNENELGLTEFAQKINLQRATQGELARTIMMMDGVEFARVHLAIPERSLFRSDQQTVTAAVTVEMRPAARLSAPRVAGIQQLVASSVPALTTANVVVLDDTGGLVSADPDILTAESAVTERDAIEQLLQLRAQEAISTTLPQQPFQVQVSAFSKDIEGEAAADGAAEAQSEASVLGAANRALRILVRTPQTLGKEERDLIALALASSVNFSPDRGDMLDFASGALVDPAQNVASSAPSAQPERQLPPSPAAPRATGAWTEQFAFDRWTLIPLILLAILLLAVWPRRRLSNAETESFADLLRESQLDKEPVRHV